MRTLYVCTCGKSKQDQPAPAREMYTGYFTQRCILYAERHAARLPDAGVVIVSARYGLLTLDQVIEPYDTYVGGIGSIDKYTLREQVARAGLLDVPDVRFIGGRPYLPRIRWSWPHVTEVFPPRMLGSHCQFIWLRENTPTAPTT